MRRLLITILIIGIALIFLGSCTSYTCPTYAAVPAVEDVENSDPHI